MPNPLSDALAELLTETVGLVKEQRVLARESTTLVRLLNRVIGDLINPPDTIPPDPPGPLVLLNKRQIAMGKFEYDFIVAAPADPADVTARRVEVKRFGADGAELPAEDPISVALDATQITVPADEGTRFLAGLSDSDANGNWSPIPEDHYFDSGTVIDDVAPATPGALTFLGKRQIFDTTPPPVEEPPVEQPPTEEPPVEPPAAG